MSVVTGLLQQIPPLVRKGLLYLWLLNAVVFLLLYMVGVDGLDYDRIKDVLLAAAGYLTLQSGANVNTEPEE